MCSRRHALVYRKRPRGGPGTATCCVTTIVRRWCRAAAMASARRRFSAARRNAPGLSCDEDAAVVDTAAEVGGGALGLNVLPCCTRCCVRVDVEPALVWAVMSKWDCH